MVWIVTVTPRPLYPWERSGTHCIGGWVGPRAGLDGYRKSRPQRYSIPGPSSQYRVPIPTELPRSRISGRKDTKKSLIGPALSTPVQNNSCSKSLISYPLEEENRTHFRNDVILILKTKTRQPK